MLLTLPSISNRDTLSLATSGHDRKPSLVGCRLSLFISFFVLFLLVTHHFPYHPFSSPLTTYRTTLDQTTSLTPQWKRCRDRDVGRYHHGKLPALLWGNSRITLSPCFKRNSPGPKLGCSKLWRHQSNSNCCRKIGLISVVILLQENDVPFFANLLYALGFSSTSGSMSFSLIKSSSSSPDWCMLTMISQPPTNSPLM